MATAVLAGVNPIHGLYAGFAGPIAGGLTSSTRLMVITTTGASALAAGSALEGLDPADRSTGLFLIVTVAGALMIAAGLLRLGRYTRFVSVSVMMGFLTGVAANIILGQLPDLAGADAEGSTSLAKAIDLITHPSEIELASLLVGLSALALFALLAHTRIAPFASIVALAVPTLLTLGVASIQRVDDVGDIPQGVPVPHLPDLGLLFSVSVLTGALSIAAIVLVQGAGVSEAAPNPDGTISDSSRDFIAQGAGNVASGLFRGIPVGGSVGQTAINVASGARTRWAAIFVGIWMLTILVAFSGVVGRVAMPTLAAVLIYAASRSIRVGGIQTVFRTGRTSQIAIVTTFLATLFLSIPQAVGIGVALSLLLQLNKEALDLAVVELVPRLDGRFDERPAPGAPAQPRRDADRRLRQPLLRRLTHAPGQASRPGRHRVARGRAAATRPHGARRDCVRRARRLRGSAQGRGRPALPERRRPGPAGAAAADAAGRRRRQGARLRGDERRRRVELGGVSAGAGVARRARAGGWDVIAAAASGRGRRDSSSEGGALARLEDAHLDARRDAGCCFGERPGGVLQRRLVAGQAPVPGCVGPPVDRDRQPWLEQA